MNKMIKLEEYTCEEVIEMRMSMDASLKEIKDLLNKSLELGIKENVSYYTERLNRKIAVIDKLNSTFGMKRE
jgi:hypothetical protein